MPDEDAYDAIRRSYVAFGGQRPQWPTGDLPRQSIPTGLTVVTTDNLLLFYVEVVNDTNGDITVRIQDQKGLPILPPQVVRSGSVMTYNSTFGTPADGISWSASAPGLVGWFSAANV